MLESFENKPVTNRGFKWEIIDIWSWNPTLEAAEAVRWMELWGNAEQNRKGKNSERIEWEAGKNDQTCWWFPLF